MFQFLLIVGARPNVPKTVDITNNVATNLRQWRGTAVSSYATATTACKLTITSTSTIVSKWTFRKRCECAIEQYITNATYDTAAAATVSARCQGSRVRAAARRVAIADDWRTKTAIRRGVTAPATDPTANSKTKCVPRLAVGSGDVI